MKLMDIMQRGHVTWIWQSERNDQIRCWCTGRGLIFRWSEGCVALTTKVGWSLQVDFVSVVAAVSLWSQDGGPADASDSLGPVGRHGQPQFPAQKTRMEENFGRKSPTCLLLADTRPQWNNLILWFVIGSGRPYTRTARVSMHRLCPESDEICINSWWCRGFDRWNHVVTRGLKCPQTFSTFEICRPQNSSTL